jgi:hypothetical protein
MPSRVITGRCLLVAALAIAAGPTFAQAVNEGPVIVHPVRVRPQPSNLNLPPPPPGPIESRLVPLPEATRPAAPAATPPADPTAPVWQPVPERPMAPTTQASAEQPSPPSPGDRTIAVIPFAGVSANLTDGTRAELDKIAKQIADKRLRRIELRAFAPGSDLESRKIALARALVVRAYLIDVGVKSRIEVGSFAGDGGHVEILVP